MNSTSQENPKSFMHLRHTWPKLHNQLFGTKLVATMTKGHDLFLQPPDDLTCFLDHYFGHDNDQKLVIFSESKHLAFYHHPKKIAVQQ